jgi:quercetin dioxygenase-like cupin family protein
MNSNDGNAAAEPMAPTPNQTQVIDVKEMPWQQIAADVRCKVLYKDDSSGLSVVLFNFAPGATTPLHMHTGLECTYVLEGSLADHDSIVTAGNFAARIAGSVHQARAPQGSTHLVFFTKPVRNVDGQVTVFSAGSGAEKLAPR